MSPIVDNGESSLYNLCTLEGRVLLAHLQAERKAMTYFAYVVGLLMLLFSDTHNLTLEQGVDKVLDNAVAVQGVLFWVSVAISAIALIFVIILYFSSRRSRDQSITGCAGCFTAFLVLLFVGQFIMWKLSIGLADSWGPHGATDPVHFWGIVALLALLGLS